MPLIEELLVQRSDRRRNVREMIIQAATELVKETGLASFTMDVVVERAYVSKGGLLYHFPSKDELINGMIEHACSGSEQSGPSRSQ
jgi:AcrR family transcriptional regulator